MTVFAITRLALLQTMTLPQATKAQMQFLCLFIAQARRKI